MRRFHPSSYGAATPEPAAPEDYTQYLSLAKEFILPSDPVERKAVLTARIANYRRMKKKFPLAALFYDNEIAKMQARLSATDRQIEKSQKGETSVQTYRYLGWTIGTLSAFLLGSLIWRTVVLTKAVGKPR
jgi:hypothetical protein